ncbi:MAG: Asp23/Gls24 family envelope stress response protein [Firmicutes bacterium]|nr:Asp23/Gls24 family envelope stress response protein [Bacillota bacterium]MDD4263406.1 Asp23/Gls24 family envelope stress response protein [Bacillota bacterium]MDD4693721.1 Asp23/Gls24 family envelope stress response protein [Bacillota bacterium]
MPEIIKNSYGQINITENVIANLAGAAAIECYGVVGMSSRNIHDGIAELFGWDSMDKGIDIDIASNEIIVNIYLQVEYGVKINEVAHNVMERVKYSLERNVGIPVREVNVHVQGVRVPKETIQYPVIL